MRRADLSNCHMVLGWDELERICLQYGFWIERLRIAAVEVTGVLINADFRGTGIDELWVTIGNQPDRPDAQYRLVYAL